MVEIMAKVRSRLSRRRSSGGMTESNDKETRHSVGFHNNIVWEVVLGMSYKDMAVLPVYGL